MVEVLGIALITFIASIVGTVTGFGVATTMLPILINFLETGTALLIVTIVHWFNDLWKLLFFKRSLDWNLILFFGIPSMIATVVGASLIKQVPLPIFHRLLGVFLIIYVLILLIYPNFEIPPTKPREVFGGVLSGFSAGFFGIRGAITSSFLIAYDFSKELYLATMGAIALIVDTSRFATYLAIGIRLSSPLLLSLLIFIPLSFLGAYIGRILVEKIPQQQFRNLVAIFIGTIGVKLVLGW